MPDCMMFPSDWQDFIKDYSFIDTEHIYTNGSELIQVLRVNQLIEHLLKEQEAVSITTDYVDGFGNQTSHCPSCKSRLTWHSNKHYCGECGQHVLWEGR